LNITENQKNAFEHMISTIKQNKIKTVSFSVFDTLVKLPFLYSTDLFFLMENELENFSQLRTQAEKNARRNDEFSEPDITSVYNELRKISGISEETSEKFLRLESDLILKFCLPRKCGIELLREAQRMGKQIILTDDTYLSQDIIEKILKKSGITGYRMIFLSNKTGLNKSEGDIYQHILKRLKINSYELLHIGSNLRSDVEIPVSQGIASIYLPSCRTQLFRNGRLCGYIYSKTGKKINTSKYFALRCLMGMYSAYAFDYPSPEMRKGDFCENPQNMGFAVLGGIHMNKNFSPENKSQSVIINAMRQNNDILSGEKDFIGIYSKCFGDMLGKLDSEGCILPLRLLVNHADSADREILRNNLSQQDYTSWCGKITEPDISGKIDINSKSEKNHKILNRKSRKRKK